MAKTIPLKKEQLANIRKFYGLLKQKGINVSKLILFGSYAKRKANSDSDIDIAVVSSRFGRDVIKELMMLRKVSLTIDSYIEPIPLSPNDFLDPYNTLAKEIKKHGIPL